MPSLLRLIASVALQVFLMIALPLCLVATTATLGLRFVDCLPAALAYSLGWGFAAVFIRKRLAGTDQFPQWADVIIYSFVGHFIALTLVAVTKISPADGSSEVAGPVAVVGGVLLLLLVLMAFALVFGVFLLPIAGGILLTQRSMCERFSFPLRVEREGDRCCRACRYDLSGNESGVCPECGTPRDVPLG